MSAIRIPDTFDSKFRFVLVAAERAKQLLNGAPPKVEQKTRLKPAATAIKEVAEGLIKYEILSDREYDQAQRAPSTETSE